MSNSLRESLSDFEIDAIADAMPGGLEGFLKTWGWRQYARAIENAVHNAPVTEGVEAGAST